MGKKGKEKIPSEKIFQVGVRFGLAFWKEFWENGWALEWFGPIV